MKGPDVLLNNMDVLRTNMGACFVGERAVFRGHDLHADLKDMDWVELYVFGITGRRFTKEQLRLMHAMFTYTSYPDARIWNNRVAALAGSARSTHALASAASLAVTEALIYGVSPLVRSIDFLMNALEKTQRGEDLETVIRDEIRVRRIYGYGRPINATDERLPWLLALAHELDLDRGPYLRISFDIERILLSNNEMLRMNYAALVAALAADMGFAIKEFQVFVYPMLLAGMSPCFIEASDCAAGSLFPISCRHVICEDFAKRSWNMVN